MLLICHVISQDHVIQRSSDFLGRIKVSYHPARFGSCRGDIMIFVCHVTLKDHEIKPLNDFMVMSPSR